MEDYALIMLRKLITVELYNRKQDIDLLNHEKSVVKKKYFVIAAFWIVVGLFKGVAPFILPAAVLLIIGLVAGRDIRNSITLSCTQAAMLKRDMPISEVVAYVIDEKKKEKLKENRVKREFKRALILMVLLVTSTSCISYVIKEATTTREDKFPVHHEEHIFENCKGGVRLVACGTNYDQDAMVIIQPEYEGKPVLEIGKYAFAGMNMTAVTIPDSVEVIDSAAFYSCRKLEEVIFGKNVSTISGEAFMNCTSLTYIRIPKKVTEIRGNTFDGCTELRNVAMHEGITSIRAYAFNGCTSLKRIVLPSGITKISEGTFRGCKSLSSIVIPNGVKRISAHAFRNCTSLSEVSVPDSVKEIGSSAFRGCVNLSTISIPKKTSVDERTFKDTRTKIIRR